LFEPFIESYNIALENISMNKKILFNDNTIGWFKQDGKYADLKLTGEVIAYNVAIGNENKMMKLINHPKNAGHNNIYIEGKKCKYETFDVEVKTIDSYRFEEVDIIKIDAEGFEFNVLNGSVNTIRECRPIVQVEIYELCCKKYGYTPQHIIDFFLKTIGNYKFLDCDRNDLGVVWKRLKGKMDYFFVPNEKMAGV
jgi:FkbM family methyltransferase